MPLGIVVILILAVLLILGYSDGICYAFALSRFKGILFFSLLTFAFIIPPLYVEGVYLYLVPYIMLSVFAFYMLFKLSFPVKSVIFGIISAFLLWVLSLSVSPQPVGNMHAPFYVYALLLTVINVLVCYGKRSVIFNSIFAFLLFNTASVIRNEHNVILSAEIFSAVVLSALLAYYPVKRMAMIRVTGFKRGRAFQTEASDSMLINKIKNRKKK